MSNKEKMPIGRYILVTLGLVIVTIIVGIMILGLRNLIFGLIDINDFSGKTDFMIFMSSGLIGFNISLLYLGWGLIILSPIIAILAVWYANRKEKAVR